MKMKIPVKIIKQKTGDIYIWSRDNYGEIEYAATRCTENNTCEIYPTATTWWDTKTAALENLRENEAARGGLKMKTKKITYSVQPDYGGFSNAESARHCANQLAVESAARDGFAPGAVGVLAEYCDTRGKNIPSHYRLLTDPQTIHSGIPGNCDHTRREHYGWRGTTDDIALYAHGVWRVRGVYPRSRGCGTVALVEKIREEEK